MMKLPMEPPTSSNERCRTIDMGLGSYPAGLMFERIITARWIFDERDRLTDNSVSSATLSAYNVLFREYA